MKNACASSKTGKIRSILNNPWLVKTAGALRYSLYLIAHPLDGAWDLKHENRGTLGAANIIVFLTLLAKLLSLQFTSFLFLDVNWENVNIWLEIAKILLPFLLFVIANWALTTLFDGKGGMKDVYIMTAYALTPFPLIRIPLCFASNVLAIDEGALYTFFSALSIGWCAVLLLCGLMQTHEYTMSKTVLSLFATLVGMAVIIVLLMLVFSMTSEAVSYFVSLFREIIIRLY